MSSIHFRISEVALWTWHALRLALSLSIRHSSPLSTKLSSLSKKRVLFGPTRSQLILFCLNFCRFWSRDAMYLTLSCCSAPLCLPLAWLVCFGAVSSASPYISMSVDDADGDPAQCQSFRGPVEGSRPKRRNVFPSQHHHKKAKIHYNKLMGVMYKRKMYVFTYICMLCL